MKNALVGMLLTSVLILPAAAGGESGHHGSAGGSGGGSGAAANSSSTATGGAGGAGGNGTGGNATGGSATGGNATGGAATGGRSNASGNTSTVTVTLDNGGSGSGSAGSAAADPNGTTVRYDGSYTVKSAPPIAAPSLTSTFSDTCMGSASFGLSVTGFGATGGKTMVDEACVRRLDSREFRAMGLNDVALALLCQSEANRKAVEATGRACPSTAPANDEAAAADAAAPQLASQGAR